MRSRRVRLVGPRLYSPLPPAKLPDALRASWATIVSTLFPRALISHRTALEFRPARAGDVFLTSSTNRDIAYPGLQLRFLRGPGPLDDDAMFMAVRASSRARAFLENLTPVRPGARARALSQAELEQRLEQILQTEGEQALQALRARARAIASELGWRKAFDRLDGLVGEFLGTRWGHVVSDVGRARAAGEPFDPRCVERLQILFGELRGRPVPDVPDPFSRPDHARNKAFFEAYFSNYIEGTTFEIEEAESIIFDRKVPAKRPEDAHDVLGTFQLVSDPREMRRTPETAAQLIDLLRSRHRTLMSRRPEADPGELKQRPNRAGDTHFVDPPYVHGTLAQGLALHRELSPGLARAIFMMFLVSDVHPFVDGNGRIARVMMNAELVAAGRSTIIIPTVFREDYLLALRALTRRHRPDPLITALAAAQRFSTLEYAPYPAALRELERRNWFREPDAARIIT